MEFPQSIALERTHMASICGLRTLIKGAVESNRFLNLTENVPRKKIPNKRISNINNDTRYERTSIHKEQWSDLRHNNHRLNTYPISRDHVQRKDFKY